MSKVMYVEAGDGSREEKIGRPETGICDLVLCVLNFLCMGGFTRTVAES